MAFKDTGETCPVCNESITYLRALDIWVCTQCKHVTEDGRELPLILIRGKQLKQLLTSVFDDMSKFSEAMYRRVDEYDS